MLQLFKYLGIVTMETAMYKTYISFRLYTHPSDKLHPHTYDISPLAFFHQMTFIISESCS